MPEGVGIRLAVDSPPDLLRQSTQIDFAEGNSTGRGVAGKPL
jgi:hypothetical protein